ncbi:hypothetical protein BGX38DRAFT_725710 [Terfezia claveryi]|nr:hypothetical protein BGX38DRAFT_725710 [Terfezia claveryi]
MESPTDLLDRIRKIDAVISMIEAGSRIDAPIPIPVYTLVQYYSFTGAEREAYHTLQQMFYGEIVVPGLAATMPGRGEDSIAPKSMYMGLSISTPMGSPVEGRCAQSWPESGGLSDAESVCSEGTLVEQLSPTASPTEYEAFANWKPYLSSRSRASSVYDGEVADSHRPEGIVLSEETLVGRPEETLVGRPLPAEYEELAKGNPHLMIRIHYSREYHTLISRGPT